MPVPDKPPEARTRKRRAATTSEPGADSVINRRKKASTRPSGLEGTSRVRHRSALAVVDTALGQLDGIAGLGADAALHGAPVDLLDVVAAVDRVGRRLDGALRVLDLRGPQP